MQIKKKRPYLKAGALLFHKTGFQYLRGGQVFSGPMEKFIPLVPCRAMHLQLSQPGTNHPGL